MVTERYANLGTLVQAGTSSSTQAMPIVRLSQDDLFRLVIPIPESLLFRYIFVRRRSGECSRALSLNRTFPGKVARFSVDVRADTRTMHNRSRRSESRERVLMPGSLRWKPRLKARRKRQTFPTVPLPKGRKSSGAMLKRSVFVVNRDGEVEEAHCGARAADDH